MANELKLISPIYSELETIRQTILDRARDCSALTIPELIPPEGHTENDDLDQPIHNIGAQGVNNISSRLMISLLPPNNPFFRLSVQGEAKDAIEQEDPQLKTEIERGLSKIEKEVALFVETNNLRNDITLVLKLLAVSGNALMFMPDDGGVKVFSVENYVVRRDTFGNVLEIITKETINVKNLSEDIKQKVLPTLNEEQKESDLELYTRCYLNEESKYIVYQEIQEVILPETEYEYEMDNNPYIPLRWSSIKKENYGRGLVLDIKSDLEALENIYNAILDITKLMSMVKFFVNPNSVSQGIVRQLKNSRNGSFLTGNANDITTLRVDKFNDMNVQQAIKQDIENRINETFLLNKSYQRDAERVTATEIQKMAQDIESSLGGIYSMLSQELQLPLVRRIISQLEKNGKITKLPDGTVIPMITTGLEALGRDFDLTKLNAFVQQVGVFGESALSMLNMEEYIKRVGISLGVDTEGLIKSQDVVAQEQQAAQEQQMMSDVIPQVAGEAAKKML